MYTERTPVWGEGADGPPQTPGGQAASEDRKQREAWPGVRMRSAYLARVALPQTVAAGDVAQARAIQERVEAVLVETGQWTKTERARLRGMRDAWERRASGRDVEFQMSGWVRRMGKGEGDRRRLDRAEARGIQKVMEALRT